MRPIDADALAMELCQARDSWTEDDDFEKGVRMGITRGINGAKHAPTIGGWIPCSERLPNYRELVLVTTRDLRVNVAYLDTIQEDNSDVFWSSPLDDWDCALWDITAWMPLPEPYREEGDR